MPQPDGRSKRTARPRHADATIPSDLGRFALVLLCFVFSGFAGLLYETVWTRQFSLVFGTSELAVATVLAAYFAGLAAGAAVAGRWAARVRRPILAYGLLELGIAASALAIPSAIRAATSIYRLAMMGTDLSGAVGASSAGFYLLAAFVILIVPTGFMGATLPLLARFSVHRDRQIGPRVAILYAANTLGAVAGAFSAAFILLPSIGLARTVWVGAGANALVFVAAALLARRMSPQPPPAAAPRFKPDAGARWVLPAILISGAASLSYEVLWTRLLGHVLGATIYAFATMLGSFLLGIAIGSALAARWASTATRATRGFAWTQLGTAACSWLAFVLLSRGELADRVGAGVWSSLSANVALAVLVLLPSTLCIGASFPFAVRILARDENDAAPATSRIYSWNTVGGILGSIATGFLLLPRLEFAGLLIAAAGVNLLLALWTALRPLAGSRAVLAGTLVCAALLAVLRPGEPWHVLRRSALGAGPVSGDIDYYAVGRSATVLLVDSGVGWDVRTNGLPEANIRKRGAAPTRVPIQPWQTALPVLARPDAKRMLVIGLGGGVVLETAPRGLEQIDVVELEPEVIEANHRIAGRRAIDPLSDPRVRLRVNDARGALVVAQGRYDAIVSQPSHPWTSGASNLYTQEFFALVKDHLSERGVFVQWMAMNFVDSELAASLLAALGRVFEHVEVYAPHRGALLFIASPAPLDIFAHAAEALAKNPADFQSAGIFAAEDVLAALQAPEPLASAIAHDAIPTTDDFNLLQLHSRRAPQSQTPWSLFGDRPERYNAPWASEPALRWTYLVQRITDIGDVKRAASFAELCPGPAEQINCRAIVLIATGRAAEAAPLLEAALKANPQNEWARYQWVRLRSGDFLRGHPQVAEVAMQASDPVLAIFEGWRLQAKSDWTGIQELEPRLARAAPTDAAYADAMRLRVVWRLNSDDLALAQEAIGLTDVFAPSFGAPEDYMRRARASRALKDPVGALSALVEIIPDLRASRMGRDLARRALEMLDGLGDVARTAAADRVRARAQFALK